MAKSVTIVPASASDMETVRELWVEYWKAFDFSPCFQNFDQELASLPGRYAPPDGCILLAYSDSLIAGGVALRKLAHDRCEMKRLFVRPAFRGEKIGLALTRAIIEEGRNRGYSHMRLDTIPAMQRAISIYEKLHFVEIGPDSEPIPGAKYFELELSEKKARGRRDA
jgi:ribosomal protein S18 acetylase RimI-like enzyme